MISEEGDQRKNPQGEDEETSYFFKTIFSVSHFIYVTSGLMTQKVLSYDLGGTKVAVAVVNSRGRILDEIRVPAEIPNGKAAVIRQLSDLGATLLALHPEVQKVGIASAGPLNPATGELLDPTNFAGPKGKWGIVPLAKILKKALKRSVYLENDAAAAILAEHWLGAAQKYRNAMILTLGTGLGTGILCDGKLIRAGRNLHPEAGHVIIRHGDYTAPCGCGNFGCAEAYLSGANFTRRARVVLGRGKITTKEIADLARGRNRKALAAFEEYSELMAVAIHNYVRIYSPEIVIFTGSFAETSDLFLKKTEGHLKKLLARQRKGIDMLPKLVLSSLDNKAGVLGGAYVALTTSPVGQYCIAVPCDTT